ncbi:MAG: class I SAM-dependent methyltransferase [Pyrinomonadaceae bacterium]
MSRKAFDDFDGFAKDYRHIHNENIKCSGADSDYFSEQKIEEVRKNETGQSLKVLDLGCGDGNSAVFFRKYFSACEYFGLDTSKESVSLADERKLSNAAFSYYNGFDIPFSENAFDIVFIACVLHHIDSQHHEKILTEVKRVLKPCGRLYIFEHNPLNPLTRRVVKNCPFDEDAVLLTSFYTKKMLMKLEFRDVNTGYTIFFPRHWIFKGLLRLEKYLKWLPIGGQYYVRSIKGSSKTIDSYVG